VRARAWCAVASRRGVGTLRRGVTETSTRDFLGVGRLGGRRWLIWRAGQDLPHSGRRAPASCATRGTRYAARLACSVPQPPRSALRRPRRARPRPVRDARTSSARRPLLSARIVARTSLPDASRGRAWAAPREATARAWGGTTSARPLRLCAARAGAGSASASTPSRSSPPTPGRRIAARARPSASFASGRRTRRSSRRTRRA